MFARSMYRAAQPLKVQARRYATESPATPPPASNSTPTPSGSSNSTVYLAAAAAAAGAVGYYFFGGAKTPASKSVEAAATPRTSLTKAAFTGGDQGFIPLKLESSEDVNHNTKLLRFSLPDPEMVAGLPVTSAVITKFKPADKEKAVIRPYTPVQPEDAKGHMDLLVKKYPDGPMSSHIHTLKPGDTLDIKGPIPKYPWSPNKHTHIALVAGGTGITPMYQLLRSIFTNPEDKTQVTLLFGNVTEQDILLRPELDKLENTFPRRFRAFYLLDKAPANWAGETGYVTKDLLKKVLPEPKEDNIKVFVCGPPGLMNAVSGNKKSPQDQGELTGALKELGYKPEQVFKF